MPTGVGAASGLPPCVGVDGATQYSIFFLEFYRFDVPKIIQESTANPLVT